jgi:hypothetical protein
MKAETLRRHLESSSHKDLVEIVLELAHRNPAVVPLLAARFGEEIPEFNTESHREEVRDEFFPSRGIGGGSSSVAYRALRRLEDEGAPPGALIDFIYRCVETGVAFTEAYGDIDEEYYTAFEDLYERAAKLATASGMRAEQGRS